MVKGELGMRVEVWRMAMRGWNAEQHKASLGRDGSSRVCVDCGPRCALLEWRVATWQAKAHGLSELLCSERDTTNMLLNQAYTVSTAAMSRAATHAAQYRGGAAFASLSMDEQHERVKDELSLLAEAPEVRLLNRQRDAARDGREQREDDLTCAIAQRKRARRIVHTQTARLATELASLCPALLTAKKSPFLQEGAGLIPDLLGRVLHASSTTLWSSQDSLTPPISASLGPLGTLLSSSNGRQVARINALLAIPHLMIAKVFQVCADGPAESSRRKRQKSHRSGRLGSRSLESVQLYLSSRAGQEMHHRMCSR